MRENLSCETWKNYSSFIFHVHVFIQKIVQYVQAYKIVYILYIYRLETGDTVFHRSIVYISQYECIAEVHLYGIAFADHSEKCHVDRSMWCTSDRTIGGIAL